MKIEKKYLSIAIILILMLDIGVPLSSLSTANAQSYTDKNNTLRATIAQLSVSPNPIGTGQPLLVNFWVFPPPRGPSWYFFTNITGFDGITVTITKPDGTKNTFMPQEGAGTSDAQGVPGHTELLGSMFFVYTPKEIGTWSIQFSMPKQTFSTSTYDFGSKTYVNGTVVYEAATSPVTTFTVQSDPVQIGLQDTPLPTGYWQAPVSANNRQWYQVDGDWLQTGYSAAGDNYNPYSKAPSSPHMLWITQPTEGGLIGGSWGSLSYLPSETASTVVMDGKAYYNKAGNVFDCIDLRTGKLVYEMPGQVSQAINIRQAAYQIGAMGGGSEQAEALAETAAAITTPSLWQLGSSSWTQYDPLTGNVLRTITNVPTGALGNNIPGRAITKNTYWFEGSDVAYMTLQYGYNTTIANRWAFSKFMKWNLTQVQNNNWTTGLQWSVNINPDDTWGPGDNALQSRLYISSASSTVAVIVGGYQNDYEGFDLNTGAMLYNKTVGFSFQQTGILPDDKFYAFETETQKLNCYDMKTGNQLWTSDVIGMYPWGEQTRFSGFANGNVYAKSYDGHWYAIDLATGKTVLTSEYIGNTTETPYGTWPLYQGPLIADGKIYYGTTEHSPTQPLMRGNKLYSYNITTGEILWSLLGVTSPSAIAEGSLLAYSQYTGLEYCFDKGQTITTVTAPQTAIPQGSSLVIQGTVTDQSPAQQGTPAISDQSMEAWMEYLHMQQPMPTNATGVNVSIDAIDPNGNFINLGTTRTDTTGNFGFQVKPDMLAAGLGMYTVIATFKGSDSYWSSTSESNFVIDPSIASTTGPTSEAATMVNTYFIPAVIAIIATIIIGFVLLFLALRKRP